jgi:hypothetical protein
MNWQIGADLADAHARVEATGGEGQLVEEQ